VSEGLAHVPEGPVPASQGGERLLDLIRVQALLRAPGGCPWDAEQTHASLLPYLLEETYEVIDAVETGDRVGLREELGDLLLQVVFHARVAEEDQADPFDVDDVAAAIVAKLIRRHPHVFAGADAGTAGEVSLSWEELKAAERPGRGPGDGIPASLPALARAQKVIARLDRAGELDGAIPAAVAGDELAGALIGLAVAAHRSGQDAESRLRATVSRLLVR
jgi:XTP/dITP diphosphohydrolase